MFGIQKPFLESSYINPVASPFPVLPLDIEGTHFSTVSAISVKEMKFGHE